MATKRTGFMVYVEPWFLADLKEMAADDGRSLSNFVLQVLISSDLVDTELSRLGRQRQVDQKG